MTITQAVLIVAILNFILGFYTWKTKYKDPLNVTFGIFALTVGTWVLLNYLFQVNPNSLFLKAVYSVGPFIIVNGFLWIHYLKNKEISSNFFIILIVLYLLSITSAIFMFWDGSMIKNVTNIYEYEVGPLFPVYSTFMILLFISYVSYIIYEYHRSDESHKKQLKFISLGMVIVIIVTALVSFILPTFYDYSRLNVLDSPSSIVFVLFASLSILKHQLLDIRTVITEIIIYLLIVVVFIVLFVTKGETGTIMRILLMIALIYGSYLLVKSVKQEIKRRQELKRLSDQLTIANLHLKELDAMKTEFVSLASHELLTPVSAIEGYLSMLLDEKMAKIEDPKAQKYMDRVYTSAKRLARLVTDMLNVSRIEEGRLLVQKKELDLRNLINQVIDEIKFKAEEKKQKIVFNGKQQTADSSQQEAVSRKPEAVSQFMTFGDPDKIKEVVINLLGNSIKYSKNPGTVTVRIEKVPTPWVAEKWQKIEQDIKERPLDDQEAIKSVADPHLRDLVGPQQLLISVQDQGIGIPKEELPRLFKKFHRVGDYTTAESQGTGLGLYISRALVELHHGRIWADSEGHSHGSTFTFSLPDIAEKENIIGLEKQVPQDKEKLKPLAKPVKEAEDI